MPNLIEKSKSGRATCKVCKSKILKDVPRFGKEQTFKQGDKEYTSYHWHHFECAMEKYPKELANAQVNMTLPDDLKAKLDELSETHSKSAFSISGIATHVAENRRVNLKTKVAKLLKVRESEHFEGDQRISRSLFIEDNGTRSKLFLWDDLASSPIEKGDTIVAIGVYTIRASNDNIQFHTLDNSKILINPNKEEIAKNSKTVKIFEAKSWTRPSGKDVMMEYAKSNRATCRVCEEKIVKDSLKVVKPVWTKNEANQMFPSAQSFHLLCAVKDENGEDLIHEAISRITPELLKDEKKALNDLFNVLPEIEARKVLETILN